MIFVWVDYIMFILYKYKLNKVSITIDVYCFIALN
jgi:hypothetical protein